MNSRRTRNKSDAGSPTIVAHELASGELVELVYDPVGLITAFAVGRADSWCVVPQIEEGERTLVPVPADNSLIRHGMVLLPKMPEAFTSEHDLRLAVTNYLCRYLDLDDDIEQLVCSYILFTWLFDCFNEVPYLRVQGDYGTGKTRFLQIVGSVCYRPLFTNGATTVSPIFHMLDAFGGTLIVDEADLRLSDETAELVKLFNNGNVRGMPIVRSQVQRDREFNPRVFSVFGPKIVAMRGAYADDALESRVLTIPSIQRHVRDDIPLNLPRDYADEARALRNHLLAYRFACFGTVELDNRLSMSGVGYRRNQIVIPLLASIGDETVRAEVQATARKLTVGGRDE